MDIFLAGTTIAVLAVAAFICYALWQVVELIRAIRSGRVAVQAVVAVLLVLIKTMTKQSRIVKVAEGVGAGLAVAVTAAAAGYYFYGSAKAKQHRKIVATWADHMKQEVLKESKRLKIVGPEAIATIVDSVASTYHDLKDISQKDIQRASTELKTNWRKIKNEASKSKRNARESGSK